jgi:hypothetical protein
MSTETTPADYLNAANRLAPEPETRAAATPEAWVRHYAALALAAHAAFRSTLPGLGPGAVPVTGPDLGYLMGIATSALAAVCALTLGPAMAARRIWDLTPELGSLNGQEVDWLAELLADLGINPADLYPWFDADDFPVAGSAPAEGTR